MSVISSVRMTGRKPIFTDYDVITAKNLLTVLDDAYAKHLANRDAIDFLFRYNNGEQPIINRQKEVRPEINNRIVVNRANEITSFKVGYLLGEPLQYVSRNAEEEDVSDKVTKLNEYMYVEDKAAKDKELADWFTICGTSYRLVLPDKEGKSDSPIHIYTLDPRQTFIVYHNGLGNKPVMGVKYIVREGEYNPIFSIYTENMYFEVEDNRITKVEPHIMGDIPIIEYPANASRLGAFEVVVPLLDAYNQTISDRVNGLEQFIQSLIKFINVDITEEEVEKLKVLGGIKFKSTSDNPADVQYITPELNQSQTQIVLDDMYQTILTICGMPNRNGGSSTSDTGSAVIMRDGWEVAEAKAKDTEQMFKRSEKKFLRVALNILSTTAGLDLKVPQIDIRFTRRNYENIQDKVNVLVSMLNNDKIDPKLAFAHCGLFPDAELAYERSLEYYKTRQQELEKRARAKVEGDGNGAGGNVEG